MTLKSFYMYLNKIHHKHNYDKIFVDFYFNLHGTFPCCVIHKFTISKFRFNDQKYYENRFSNLKIFSYAIAAPNKHTRKSGRKNEAFYVC